MSLKQASLDVLLEAVLGVLLWQTMKRAGWEVSQAKERSKICRSISADILSSSWPLDPPSQVHKNHWWCSKQFHYSNSGLLLAKKTNASLSYFEIPRIEFGAFCIQITFSATKLFCQNIEKNILKHLNYMNNTQQHIWLCINLCSDSRLGLPLSCYDRSTHLLLLEVYGHHDLDEIGKVRVVSFFFH